MGRETRDGRALFTTDGRALYLRSFDALTGPSLPLHSTCTGTCATAWPPLLAPGPDGPFVTRGGVRASKVGTVAETVGGTTVYQVTYYGHPLYEFVKDAAPGDVTGENVAAFDALWQLASTRGFPSAGPATVSLEVSSNGVVLSTPTAFGTYRSLYELTYDPRYHTTCVGPCTAIWPPLLTTRPPRAASGVERSGLGAIRRADGSFQVTYFGRPLYLFAFDLGAGAPSGLTGGEYLVDQLAHGIWYLVSPSGPVVAGQAPIDTMTTPQGTVLGMNPPSVFAARPFALYGFTADTASSSGCYGTCARYWPPVLTSQPPAAGSGVTASGLGVLARRDGTFQVTYFGHPLYFFAFDQPGKDLGQGISAFGGTFEVVNPSGALVAGA